MFSDQAGIWSALRVGVYVAILAVITSLTGWSAYRIGATVVALLDTKIVDGSGRALPEPEWSAPPFAADPRDETDTEAESVTPITTAVSHLTSAQAGPLVTAPRVSSDQPEDDPSAAFHRGNASTYKTYCVRLCDGFYWPISFSTTSDKFEADAEACQSSCGSPARLFVHPIPGGGPATMVSLDGLPYTALKSAFLFRIRYDAQCRCQAQPWEQASRNRHKFFAAAEAAKGGDQTAIANALRLKDAVAKDAKDQMAAREVAEEAAQIELAKLSQTAAVAPPRRSERPTRPTRSVRATENIRVGALDADPPSKRGFAPASGSARSWKDRVFGDN